jgi:hypothetical protein
MLALHRRNIIAEYNHNISSCVSDIENVELETRFGYYTSDGFKSTVQPYNFDRLLTYLLKYNGETITSVEPEETNDYYYTPKTYQQFSSKWRKTVYEDGEEVWMQKILVDNFDDRDYGIRVGINREINIEDPLGASSELSQLKLDKKRNKVRYSICYKEFIVDMTIVDGKYHEVEIEWDSCNDEGDITSRAMNESNYNKYESVVEDIYKNLYGTLTIYTVREKNDLILKTNSLLGSNMKNHIDRSVLVQARNLRYTDLRWGGVVGNENTPYSVTDKADGVRYLLITNSLGVWLVNPPFQYNLVERRKISTKLMFSVFDGENIPRENRRKGSPDEEIWYHVIDTLVIKGNNKVQKLPHISDVNSKFRLKYGGRLRELNDSNNINIGLKEFKEINNVSDFFNVCSYFLDRNQTLPYDTDGLIFTPIQTDYIEYLNKDKDEGLDICKWKDVITFDFKWGLKGEDEVSNIYSVDNDKQDIVYNKPFDKENALFEKATPGTIFEFKWDNGMFVPIKSRPDKIGPNYILTINDNWKSMINGIPESTLRGQDIKLSRKYFNNIKRTLFDSLPSGSTLLDIASGKGADVDKWKRFSKVVAVEPNPENAKELKRRIKLNKMSDRVLVLETTGQNSSLINHKVRDFLGGKADNCSIMLGMSFFWGKRSDFDSLVRTIKENTSNKLIFLTIDGDAVDQMFDPAFGGVKGNILEVGGGSIEYHPDNPEGAVTVRLEDTIIDPKGQLEHRVYLDDLSVAFRKLYLYRADSNPFLNEKELMYTRLFSYGAYNVSMAPVYVPKEKTLSKEKAVPIAEKAVPKVTEKAVPKGTEKTVPKGTEKAVPKGTEKTVPKVPKTPEILHKETDPLSIEDMAPLKSLSFTTEVVGGLKVRWYNGDMVRISTPGDGSCYIHALLKAFYPKYQENKNKEYRAELVSKLRRDLSLMVNEINIDKSFQDSLVDMAENEENANFTEEELKESLTEAMKEDLDNLPSKSTYWETAEDGLYIDKLTRQLMRPDLQFSGKSGDEEDVSIKGIAQLLNSNEYISDIHFPLISDLLGVSVILLKGFSDNVLITHSTHKVGMTRPIVLVLSLTAHYETVGVRRDKGIQTVFRPEDDIIVRIMEIKKGSNDFAPREYIHNDNVYLHAIITNLYDDYTIEEINKEPVLRNGKPVFINGPYRSVDKEGNLIIPNMRERSYLDDDDPYISWLDDYTEQYDKLKDGSSVIPLDKVIEIKRDLLDIGYEDIKTTDMS